MCSFALVSPSIVPFSSSSPRRFLLQTAFGFTSTHVVIPTFQSLFEYMKQNCLKPNSPSSATYVIYSRFMNFVVTTDEDLQQFIVETNDTIEVTKNKTLSIKTIEEIKLLNSPSTKSVKTNPP